MNAGGILYADLTFECGENKITHLRPRRSHLTTLGYWTTFKQKWHGNSRDNFGQKKILLDNLSGVENFSGESWRFFFPVNIFYVKLSYWSNLLQTTSTPCILSMPPLLDFFLPKYSPTKPKITVSTNMLTLPWRLPRQQQQLITKALLITTRPTVTIPTGYSQRDSYGAIELWPQEGSLVFGGGQPNCVVGMLSGAAQGWGGGLI